MARQAEWVSELNDRLPGYLERLRVPGQPGRFRPCAEGATALGKECALGFSCLAMKTFYTLNLWKEIPRSSRSEWIDFIKGFQKDGDGRYGSLARGAFVDLPAVRYLETCVPWYRRLVERVRRPCHLTHLQRMIIAETKQAIATLAQVGASSRRPYRGFPATAKATEDYLARLDWTKPWGAGAHAATLAVFFRTEAPRICPRHETESLLHTCTRFIETVLDEETGGYFQGPIPDHGELINGAMKVLTALDWLAVDIHRPEKLIDTCLAYVPPSDGCHLVDAVYVLYRCQKQTAHKRDAVCAYCSCILEMIERHGNADGGLSYGIGRSQTNYYGVPISQGRAASDIHGTCLLSWAIAMILEILDKNAFGWQVVRP